jgi:hypothetical protein
MKKVLTILSLFLTLNVFSQPQSLVNPKYTRNEILKLELPSDEFKFRVSSKLNDGAYIDFDENTMNDPFGFGAYDIKMKIYATPKLDYVQRIFISGLTNPTYFFMIGIIRKF